MIYKLKIHPNKLELIRLIFINKTNYKEVKTATQDLPFRFNRNIIVKKKYYEQMASIFNNLLAPFISDISELYIAIKPNFFQIKSIPVGFNANIFDDVHFKQYLDWEISQYISDDKQSYLYGVYQKTMSQNIYLIILRKEIHQYFKKVLNLTNGSISKFTIGLDFKSKDKGLFFVTASRTLDDYYEKQVEIKPLTGYSSPKKIKGVKVIGIVSIILIFAIFLFKNTIFSPLKKDSATASSLIIENKKELPKNQKNGKGIDSTKSLVQKAIKLSLYKTVEKIISQKSLTTLVLHKNHFKFQLKKQEEVNEFIKTTKNDLKVTSLGNGILEFTYKNKITLLGNKKEIKNTEFLKLKNYKQKYITLDLSTLNEILDELNSSNIIYSKIVISHRDQLYYMAVKFD